MPPYTCMEYQRHHTRTLVIRVSNPQPSRILRAIWFVWLLIMTLLFAPTIIREHRRFHWNRARKEKKRK